MLEGSIYGFAREVVESGMLNDKMAAVEMPAEQ